jgi:predicted nucleic acid-binding Zn ribbon protein
VFGKWDAIVGEGLARHVRPLSLRDGVLVVAVDEPAWATEVRYLEAEIVQKVQAAAGGTEVTSVGIRVDGERRRRRP